MSNYFITFLHIYVNMKLYFTSHILTYADNNIRKHTHRRSATR